MGDVELTLPRWILSALPVIVLMVSVASRKVSARTASLGVLVLSLVIAIWGFGAGPGLLGVAVGKGVWLGCWILAVVWPALLLYRIADAAGFTKVTGLIETMFSNKFEVLLLLAWLLPGFIQGVAGFGAPIAIAAPLLLAVGWSPARAVALPLIGYQWSVTFGSMGSSFYMASLTAHLSPSESADFARKAALLLGADCLLAGVVMLLLAGGVRAVVGGARLLICAGLPMVATLYLVAPVVPAIATVSAGAVGFVAAFALAGFDRSREKRLAHSGHGAVDTAPLSTFVAADVSRSVQAREVAGTAIRHGQVGPELELANGQVGLEPVRLRKTVWVVAPYVYLLGSALAVLLVPASRNWVKHHFVIGPHFPATESSLGWKNIAVSQYNPYQLFGHPGFFILLAAGLGYLTYRRVGLWPPGAGRVALSRWAHSIGSTSVSIVALACMAIVMTDTGIISILAQGAVSVTGNGYPAISPSIGALGSFMTGSTTSSNALFSPLQVHAADLVGVNQTVMLAAQTAGGNIGNAVAPVVLMVGLAAVHAPEQLSSVLRMTALAAGALLIMITGLTLLLIAIT